MIKRAGWLGASLAMVLLCWLCGVGARAAAGETATIMHATHMFDQPSLEAQSLGQLEAGALVTVYDVQEQWAQIGRAGKVGYVARSALSASAADTDAAIGITLIGRTLYVARDTELVRPAALASPVAKRGDGVTLLGIDGHTADVLWGIYPGQLPLTALALDDGCNYVLGTPGDSITDLKTRLEALGFFDGEISDIFDVQTAEAVIRFRVQAGLPDKFLIDDETTGRLAAEDAPRSFILLARLDIGDTGNSVRRLQERLTSKGYLETSVLGLYDSLTAQAVMLYQQMERLTDNGIAGPETLSLLFSGEARALPRNLMPVTEETSQYMPGAVRNVDWFEGDIDQIFAKETVAELTDIVTGLSWHEMRRGGYNHADVQPLTAEDTATFLTAVGDQWTWERRPIWVTIDGVRYAASMNCMPHGDGRITSNNFPGHHCVHFLNSRTHGSNALDDQHQLCVEVAASTDIVSALETWSIINEDMIGASDDD